MSTALLTQAQNEIKDVLRTSLFGLLADRTRMSEVQSIYDLHGRI